MEANMGLTEWLNYFFVQGRSPASLLCQSSRACFQIRIGGFRVSVSSPPLKMQTGGVFKLTSGRVEEK
jgi:hypothetical protein